MGTISTRRRQNPDPFDVSHLVAEAAERQVLAGVLDLIDRDTATARAVVGGMTAEMFHADHTGYVFGLIRHVLETIQRPRQGDVYRALRKDGYGVDSDPHLLVAELVEDQTATGNEAARIARSAAIEVRENQQRRQAIHAMEPFVRSGGAHADLLGLIEELQHLHAATADDETGGTEPDGGDAETITAAGWKPFPVQLLPSAIGDYVTQTANGMAADPALVALPMLAAAAAAIGNTRTIRLRDGWQEPAILWTAVVAKSGSLKTPAMRQALRFATAAEVQTEEHNRAVRERHDADRMIYETELAAWKQAARKHRDNAGEPPRAPTRPATVARIVSDTTIEAIASILADNPRGVLLERDELAGWLAGFDRYKAGGASRVSSEVGHWLSMHNAGTLHARRSVTTSRPSVSRT